MKQLITRIDGDLHARLKRRAAAEGRSVNALVSDLLDEAVPQEDPVAALRARAAARGILYMPPPVDGPVPTLDEVIAMTKGWGTSVSEALEETRNESWR